jgi:hypothetical protein
MFSVIAAVNEWNSNIRVPWIWILTWLPLGIAVLSALFAWLNYRWVKRLGDAASRPPTQPSKTFARHEFWSGLVALAVIAAVAVGFSRLEPPRMGEHVSREESSSFLPTSATDISFCNGKHGESAMEFSITEPDFVAWVESKVLSYVTNDANVRLQEIDSPKTIHRYSFVCQEADEADSITIEDGLYCHWLRKFGDHVVEIDVAYDRATNRAYYYDSRR